jgi:O-acetyl-ADP-ribose deacetylase (regulator of RNase III)
MLYGQILINKSHYILYTEKIMKVKILEMDITMLEVDAIVNAANNALCGGGGVDGAIHRVAGKQLLEECLTLNGCKTGHAKITKGYKLPAKFIIHTVGPVWYGGDKNEKELLASCYRECIKIANKHNFKTLAFPAISCGVYHFPIPQACEIAINEVMHLADTSLEQIIFSSFNNKITKALSTSLNKFEQLN